MWTLLNKLLEKNGEIKVKQIHLKDNMSDLFTKSLTATFEKLVHMIGMRRYKDLT